MTWSLTCELATKAGMAPPPAKVLVTVPRSTNRYSSLAVQGPERTHSDPPPAVHPPRVLVAVPLAIAVVVTTGKPGMVIDTALVMVAFDSTSPKAAPPVM